MRVAYLALILGLCTGASVPAQGSDEPAHKSSAPSDPLNPPIQSPFCPNGCFDRGNCYDGKCVCYPGFGGVDCSETYCANDCSGHGKCVNVTTCVCDFLWGGGDCSQQFCLNDCTGKGECIKGKCKCIPGWKGEDCDTLDYKIIQMGNKAPRKKEFETRVASKKEMKDGQCKLSCFYTMGAGTKEKQILVTYGPNSGQEAECPEFHNGHTLQSCKHDCGTLWCVFEKETWKHRNEVGAQIDMDNSGDLENHRHADPNVFKYDQDGPGSRATFKGMYPIIPMVHPKWDRSVFKQMFLNFCPSTWENVNDKSEPFGYAMKGVHALQTCTLVPHKPFYPKFTTGGGGAMAAASAASAAASASSAVVLADVATALGPEPHADMQD